MTSLGLSLWHSFSTSRPRSYWKHTCTVQYWHCYRAVVHLSRYQCVLFIKTWLRVSLKTDIYDLASAHYDFNRFYNLPLSNQMMEANNLPKNQKLCSWYHKHLSEERHVATSAYLLPNRFKPSTYSKLP